MIWTPSTADIIGHTAKVDSSENTVLNLEELETELVSPDEILPSENNQDVVVISSGDKEANVVTNFENKSLPDPEIETSKNNEMLTDVSSGRCQRIRESQSKMSCGLQDSIFGQ